MPTVRLTVVPVVAPARSDAIKIAAHPALAPSFGAFIKLRGGMGERLVGRAFRTSRVKADGTNAMWPQFCCQQAKHRFNSCPCWTKACRVGESNLRNHCRQAHPIALSVYVCQLVF